MAFRFAAMAAGFAALALGVLQPPPIAAAPAKDCMTKRKISSPCHTRWLAPSLRPAYDRRRSVFPYPPGSARRRSDPGSVRVQQLPPELRARSWSRLGIEPQPERCRAGRRLTPSGCAVQRGLPEALIQAPDASTEDTLRQLGIPAIADVPPIATLRGPRARRR